MNWKPDIDNVNKRIVEGNLSWSEVGCWYFVIAIFMFILGIVTK